MDTTKTHEEIATAIVDGRTMLDAVRRQSLINDIAQALHASQSSLSAEIMASLPEKSGFTMKETAEFQSVTGFMQANASRNGYNEARAQVLTFLKSKGLIDQK